MIYFTAHTFKCVCHCRRAMFRVLGMYNFGLEHKFVKQNVGFFWEYLKIGNFSSEINWPLVLQWTCSCLCIFKYWFLGKMAFYNACFYYSISHLQWSISSNIIESNINVDKNLSRFLASDRTYFLFLFTVLFPFPFDFLPL